MAIIVGLILISLSIAIFFLAVFYWSFKNGQYDDTYTPSVRMLFDEKKREPKAEIHANVQPLKNSPES